MFVPRSIQIQKAGAPGKKQSPSGNSASQKPSELCERPPKRVRIQDERVELALDKDYATEVVQTLEIIFSDYSLQRRLNRTWISERHRDCDGHDDYVHLSALIDHHLVSTIKPMPTLKKLVEALGSVPSQLLQVSTDRYHLRRSKPYSPDLQKESWDDSTVYIEPHYTGLTNIPGRVARLIAQFDPARRVEHVDSGSKAWALVVLSDTVSEEDVARKENWPEDWIVLTKAEWERRNALYRKLKEQETNQASSVAAYPASLGPGPFSAPTAAPAPIPTVKKPPETTSKASAASPLPGYIPGLILYLENLHPETTKTTITSFLTRAVDRYLRKDGKLGKSSSSSDFTIGYVDYKPKSNFTNAHIRVKSSADAELLVRALEKRKRGMQTGGDGKGRKCSPEQKERREWVKGVVISGERERLYWQKLNGAKKGR